MNSNPTFVNTKQPFEDQLIHDAREQTSDNIYIPPYCESTCEDKQIFRAIDARYKQLMRDTGNNPYIIFTAFNEYLYERYSVDPEDLEFIFTVFHYSREDAIKKTAEHNAVTFAPVIAQNVIKQLFETYGTQADNIDEDE